MHSQSMVLGFAFASLKRPFVALALCALLTQQVVGFVLVASPAMAIESGFSLCLSGPIDGSADPFDSVAGAGFCPCTLSGVVAVLPTQNALPSDPLIADTALDVPTRVLRLDTPPTGPPPARAPPSILHI